MSAPRRPLAYRVRLALHDWGIAQGWHCMAHDGDLAVSHDHRCDDLTALVSGLIENALATAAPATQVPARARICARTECGAEAVWGSPSCRSHTDNTPTCQPWCGTDDWPGDEGNHESVWLGPRLGPGRVDGYCSEACYDAGMQPKSPAKESCATCGGYGVLVPRYGSNIRPCSDCERGRALAAGAATTGPATLQPGQRCTKNRDHGNPEHAFDASEEIGWSITGEAHRCARVEPAVPIETAEYHAQGDPPADVLAIVRAEYHRTGTACRCPANGPCPCACHRGPTETGMPDFDAIVAAAGPLPTTGMAGAAPPTPRPRMVDDNLRRIAAGPDDPASPVAPTPTEPAPRGTPPACGTCGGMGVTQFDYADSTPSLVEPCWACHGSGVEMARTDDGVEGVDCRSCKGTGRAAPETPVTCAAWCGSGVTAERTYAGYCSPACRDAGRPINPPTTTQGER